MPAAPVTYARAAADIRVEPLDGLTLVFHRLSGATHILSREMSAIFALVPEPDGGAAGIDAAGVTAVLAAAHGALEAEDADPAQVVAARLEELAGLGIVRRLHG